MRNAERRNRSRRKETRMRNSRARVAPVIWPYVQSPSPPQQQQLQQQASVMQSDRNDTADDDLSVDKNQTLDEYLHSVRGPKHLPLNVVLPITIVYVMIFVTGVLGNIAVCVVIVRNMSLHTATNYYLFSLALSDLTLLLLGKIYITFCKVLGLYRTVLSEERWVHSKRNPQHITSTYGHSLFAILVKWMLCGL